MIDRSPQTPPDQELPAETAGLLQECERLRQQLSDARVRETTAVATAIHWRDLAIRGWAGAATGSADRRDVTQLAERAEHLEAELQRTHATVSWRVTAPLRRVRRLRSRRPAQ